MLSQDEEWGRSWLASTGSESPGSGTGKVPGRADKASASLHAVSGPLYLVVVLVRLSSLTGW